MRLRERLSDTPLVIAIGMTAVAFSAVGAFALNLSPKRRYGITLAC